MDTLQVKKLCTMGYELMTRYELFNYVSELSQHCSHLDIFQF